MSDIEIRNVDEEFGPDEIIATDAASVHFEYMDDGHVWCGIALRDGRYVHVHLHTKRGAKIATRYEIKEAA